MYTRIVPRNSRNTTSRDVHSHVNILSSTYKHVDILRLLSFSRASTHYDVHGVTSREGKRLGAHLLCELVNAYVNM
eukprot:1364459-Amorphochlora_amoeboformis.AAC.1